MIVVTAPTSTIGRQVLENLVRSGAAVRAIARDPERIPASTRQRIEVVQGSHGDAAIVDRAFKNADEVFWLAPPNLTAPSLAAVFSEFARPAIAAFRKHEVKRVVGISALGRGVPVAANAGLVTASLAMDDLIASSGVSFRALALPGFMDNMLRHVDTIKSQGVFYWPLSATHRARHCATRDIAAIATKLLCDRSWSGSGEVPLLGPEDLSFDEIAKIMSEVLERPVRYERVPSDAFKATLRSHGASEAFAQGMVDMFEAKNAGLDDGVKRTPETSTPTSFRTFCEDTLKPALLA